VLLSGGLDSSTITALTARELRDPVRMFAVDLVDQAANLTPTELRPTHDRPYVHDVAAHIGADHTDIVLDHSKLADADIRRTVIRARDLPMGNGDRDASPYLLFQAIREQSTVALSGESADELFGGYRDLHDPTVQQTDAFPWIAFGDANSEILTPALSSAVDLDAYRHDRYTEAVREVAGLDGEDDFAHRMRVMSYLHLTRLLRILLGRRDRMSMAVGLGVRVPYCDHRLVEHVYNSPWSLKTYDGREKSLLRGAARDLLPASVAQRVKRPYPTASDPRYAAAIQAQAKDLLGTGNDVLFALVDRTALEQLTRLDPTTLQPEQRARIERAPDLSVWIDMYRPGIVF